jgi:hypothetical protein
MENSLTIVGLVVVLGLSLGLLAHTCATRRMMPVLKELATELNGEVRQASIFLLPKLAFHHKNLMVEVSSASSGTSSPGGRFTYVLFSGLVSDDFHFHILPRSVQTKVDEATGLKSPVKLQNQDLDSHFSVYTTDEGRMQTILEHISADDLLCGTKIREPSIDEIRKYDDKLMYSVSGTLSDYSQYKSLVDRATRFYDACDAVESGRSAENHGIGGTAHS